MGRIFPEKNLSSIAKKWIELVPKIYEVAEKENNPNITVFIDNAESYSEGKLDL